NLAAVPRQSQSSLVRICPRIACAGRVPDHSPAAAQCEHRDPVLPTTGLERLVQPALAEEAMFESFECQCIYVEITNESHPRLGRVEYCAKSCAVCQVRAALTRVDNRAIVAFDSSAPRYQRMH